ncbi:SHOCT domain-containing protein [Methanosarcina sp. UBA5]|uniref:SHOCT domain-containing protein n=1 Tax=Methanosarcina sp. UBA5 TaxID=1915593 RepID=UPI0025DE2F29|nr:SHOCT domain-containing protein [Methanosarcina sp. UBA5]
MIGLSEILAIFIVLGFWISIIVLACLGIKYIINQKKTCGYEEKSALDIAKERYAKGEITKEEFEEMKKTLISK